MKNKFNTTEYCKVLIAGNRPETESKDWKRVLKTGDDNHSVRVFNNTKTGESLVVVYKNPLGSFSRDECGFFSVFTLDAFNKEAIKQRLLNACRSIKHCGDYCHLFWKDSEKSAWITMGDGDGEEPGSTMEEIRELLMSAGAERVLIEAESDPDFDPEFVCLGRNLGVVVERD